MNCMEGCECGIVVRVYREINGGYMYILFLVWGGGRYFFWKRVFQESYNE